MCYQNISREKIKTSLVYNEEKKFIQYVKNVISISLLLNTIIVMILPTIYCF